MTTDTRPKEHAVQVSTGEGVFCIGGITKGAGMIAPNMATMLAYIASDAVVAQTDLQAILRAVVRKTFNCVTIDGDTSTNDTVILAATGASGVALESADALARFEAGLYRVCKELAPGHRSRWGGSQQGGGGENHRRRQRGAGASGCEVGF